MNLPKLLSFAALSLALALSAAAKPQLGLQSWTCRNMTFEETVLFARAHGITQVEFFGKHLDPKSSKDENLAKLAFLKKHGVTAYSIGVSATTMNSDENRSLFELAKLFGMKVIVVEPGEPAQWDNLEALVKEYDIKLAIHNHGTGTVYGNPATVKHVLAERDHRIGVCMDVGWVTAAGFDAENIFRNYGDRVFDMHLKDKRLDKTDDRNRATDTFIGLGNSNYAGLFAAIKETKWSGVMAIETDSADFAKDPAAFVAAAKKFFEHHVGKN
jgi:sugar phosphate isomerase/epimerase